MLFGYPNTRKREEALVGAYFGIYDGSLTARNKGTLAGGPGCCWSGGGLVVVWVCMVSLTSKGGSGKTGGWFRERGESIAHTSPVAISQLHGKDFPTCWDEDNFAQEKPFGGVYAF